MYKRKDSWYSDFEYKGERFVESHGPVSKTVAKEKDTALRAKVANGEYLKSKNDPPFDAALDEYLKKSEAENQKSTYKRNIHSAGYLKAHFGSKKISMIESNQVIMRQYVEKRKEQIRTKQMGKGGRLERECSFTSINRELALLRSMFNQLIKASKARKNPVQLVKMFEEVQKERILTPEEQAAILKAIDESDKRYHHLKDIVLFCLNTAARIGEILAIEKSWILLEAGVINIPRYSQKRKAKDKRVPINSVLLPIIQRRMEQHPDSIYLFVNPQTGTRYTRIQNSWDQILKKADLQGKPWVDKLRIHDLRHTAASNLARAGKDIKFIAQYLGHADVKTTSRYIHYNDEDLKKGAEILAKVPSNSPTLKVVSS